MRRRDLLRSSVALGAGALAGVRPRLSAGAVDTLPLIPERVSVNGLLDTSMIVRFAPNTVGGRVINTRTFDGGIPAPTLRLQRGDTLRVRFTNGLPANTDPFVSHNQPHHFNSFNLHTHGLHVDPTGISDNVYLNIGPGQTHQSQIQIPANHPGGLYWYHPHKHGSVFAQIRSGMAGAIVIAGELDQVTEVAAAAERLLVIQELRVKQSDGTINEVGEAEPEDQIWLVNGAVQPTITIRPGEVQRFRIVYEGLTTTYPLRFDGHGWYQLALDGITLYAPLQADEIVLAPGNRADVLVRGGSPGTYSLRLGPFVLATVVVEGTPASMAFPSSLPAEPLHSTVADSEVKRTRTFTFGPGLTVNGLTFDPNRIDYTVPLGSVEEWTLSNLTGMPHPFHLHTNAFEVIEVGGAPLTQKRWMDVIDVPGQSSVKIRIRFQDFTGKMPVHCHNLSHSEVGMMTNVNVVKPIAPVLPAILDLLLSD